MTKPTEQLIEEILTDIVIAIRRQFVIEYALDVAVNEIVIKNAREKIEKIIAEAYKRGKKETMEAIEKMEKTRKEKQKES